MELERLAIVNRKEITALLRKQGIGLRDVREAVAVVYVEYSPSEDGFFVRTVYAHRITLAPGKAAFRSTGAQTNGELQQQDYAPPTCERPLCSFQAVYILDRKGELKAVTRRQTRTNNDGAAEHARAVAVKQRLFQDVWNLYLERLKRRSIHIIVGKRHPTAINGSRLHPGLT
jgi:hypothetical protein